MQVTKFLHKEDVPRVLKDRTIRLGSFSSYRRQDEHDYIGDRQEGIYSSQIDDQPFSKGEIKKLFEIAEARGAVLDRLPLEGEYVKPVAITLSGALITMSSNALIFCASLGPPELLFSAWQQKMRNSGSEPYGAALCIHSMEALARDICKSGEIVNGSRTGYKISDLCANPFVRQVRYQDNTDIIKYISEHKFNYAVKRSAYSWQSEIRIVFELDLHACDYLDFSDDYVIVRLQNTEDHFSQLGASYLGS